MINSRSYPFTRNRYFYGKLLTVQDFELEQKYFVHKQRIMNKLISGSGILTGLDVVVVNDKAISIDPGIAVDNQGQEIVVPTPVMRVLSDLPGFDMENTRDDYYLCLEYNELPVQLVHSVSQGTDEGEYSRIQEGYSLSLKSKYMSAVEKLRSKLLHTKYTLYDTEQMKIELILLDMTGHDDPFKAKMIVDRKIEGIPTSVQLKLQGQYLNEGRPIELLYDSDETAETEQYVVEKTIDVRDFNNAIDILKLVDNCLTITIGDRSIERSVEISHQVELLEESIENSILKKYYRLPLDEILSVTEEECICLAKIRVIPAGQTYVIDKIERPTHEDYILPYTLNNLIQGRKVRNVCKAEEKQDRNEMEEEANIPQRIHNLEKAQRIESIRTGVYTFGALKNRKRGQVTYSEEVSHGLGQGDGFLTFAIEHLPQVSVEYGSARQVFFGDPDAFSQSSYTATLPNVKISAVLYPNKGTFRIAVALDDRGWDESVRIRWRFEKTTASTNVPIANMDKSMIRIEPNPAHVMPRDKILLTLVGEDSEILESSWKIDDPFAGEIDQNGLYTAPAKEGVYSVTAVDRDGRTITGYVLVENKN